MFLVYFDETGDDGYPKTSSNSFIFTSVCIDKSLWGKNNLIIRDFRHELHREYRIPSNMELHTKHLLCDKNPYRQFNLSKDDIISIIDVYFKMISTLDISIVNTIIDKNNIRDSYDVLGNAFKYNVQRIENTIDYNCPDKNFLIITDEGRVGKMKDVTRRMRKSNVIPSSELLNPSIVYYNENEIKHLIEDPLPKNSKDSYYIQICDFISYFVHLYYKTQYLNENWAKRIYYFDLDYVIEKLDLIKPVLNLRASRYNEYGFVIYPKK